MNSSPLLGGLWLVEHYGLALVMPLAVNSSIGGRRITELIDGIQHETFVVSMRPAANLRGHLTFHLKHEVPHLELLDRLFKRIDTAELVAWIEDEPSGQYARRAGFLFEWLTGQTLPVRVPTAGAYVDVLNDQKLVTATRDQAVPNRRWRVRDNMPGAPAFCPIIRRTQAVNAAMALDIQGLLRQLAHEFGEDLLMRSTVWMTLRESKSSFAIEGEGHQSDRIQRFADVLSRCTGEGKLPLDAERLTKLQADILGKHTTLQHLGMRQSPVFVGEVVRYQEVVHYVAPPAADVPAMLNGLTLFWQRTEGQSAVMRAAVMSFGFVYIHPLADGNGRVHRFLINDVLRRDGVVLPPMILPVSSLISSVAAERRSYDQILDTIARPLMSQLTGHYAFSKSSTEYTDGIRSNFVFKGEEIAKPAWRFLDLSLHVTYLANALTRTIQEDMREESRYLQRHANARSALKYIAEMPDTQADRVIRAIEINHGQLSNALLKEMPLLSEPGIWDDIVLAVKQALGTAQ